MAELTPRLQALRDEIEQHAHDFGLDFPEVVFELLPSDELNAVAALGGFPNRYPHWRFGMAYDQLSKGYDHGLSKIYEMVVNTDPAYAYLMDCNEEVDQKLVMAHVFGHADFFRHNFAFAHTNRKMMDEMANHATRVRRHIDRVGLERVEAFIDRCLSLENLIDPQAPHPRRRGPPPAEDASPPQPLRSPHEYMRGYINPPGYLESQQRRREEDEQRRRRRFPSEPQRDVLGFLLEHAPLEEWERDILSIVREEALYFAPQGQTKILNEGWASYWHSTIMTRRALRDSEVVDYADHHAGTMGVRPGALNPYKLGIELLRDIEARWDSGRFGPEYEACDDLAERRQWHRPTGQGRQKLFEVRRHHNDVTFIDAFLTPEFAHEQQLFRFGFNEKGNRWEIVDRDFRRVKSRLLAQLTNLGQPQVEVVDGNFENRAELLLAHRHPAAELERPPGRDTLEQLFALWQRPVNLHTVADGGGTLWRYDGRDHTERRASL